MDKLGIAVVGIWFVSIGIKLQKQQNKQWRAYFVGGTVMLVLVVVAFVFGLSM